MGQLFSAQTGQCSLRPFTHSFPPGTFIESFPGDKPWVPPLTLLAPLQGWPLPASPVLTAPPLSPTVTPTPRTAGSHRGQKSDVGLTPPLYTSCVLQVTSWTVWNLGPLILASSSHPVSHTHTHPQLWVLAVAHQLVCLPQTAQPSWHLRVLTPGDTPATPILLRAWSCGSPQGIPSHLITPSSGPRQAHTHPHNCHYNQFPEAPGIPSPRLPLEPPGLRFQRGCPRDVATSRCSKRGSPPRPLSSRLAPYIQCLTSRLTSRALLPGPLHHHRAQSGHLARIHSQPQAMVLLGRAPGSCC